MAIFVHCNLTNPKRVCLRELINSLVALEKELEKEITTLTNRHTAGSFFLSNKDINDIRDKKTVIDGILDLVLDTMVSRKDTLTDGKAVRRKIIYFPSDHKTHIKGSRQYCWYNQQGRCRG